MAIQEAESHSQYKKWLEPDSNGDTLIHLGARNGFFNHVPTIFHTEKCLSVTNKIGRTAVHDAANNGNIHQIPRHLLTVKAILCQDNEGFSPLHLALIKCCAGAIPKDIVIEALNEPLGMWICESFTREYMSCIFGESALKTWNCLLANHKQILSSIFKRSFTPKNMQELLEIRDDGEETWE